MRTKLTKITLAAAIAASFALSTAFAANLPKNCTDEIVALSKGSGFSMTQFTSDLPAAVVKAKAQAKLPFGKPKDNEKTSVGMTFGCLKLFPESPVEILSTLKDVSQEIAKGATANQLGAGQPAQAQYQPQQVQPQYQYPPQQQQAQPQYQYPPQQVPLEYQQQAQPQYQYPPQQEQPYYPPQQQVQPQYQQQPPPPQYQYPPQYAQPYYPPPQSPPQCPKCECNYGLQSNNSTASEKQPSNFTSGERFLTWFLNTLIPIGAGSLFIMEDYTGMFLQMVLNGTGVGGIASKSYGLGGALLGASAVFNIARSATYNEPIVPVKYDYTSNKYSGFNLAILPNENGKFMPYVMYNKTF